MLKLNIFQCLMYWNDGVNSLNSHTTSHLIHFPQSSLIMHCASITLWHAYFNWETLFIFEINTQTNTPLPKRNTPFHCSTPKKYKQWLIAAASDCPVSIANITETACIASLKHSKNKVAHVSNKNKETSLSVVSSITSLQRSSSISCLIS